MSSPDVGGSGGDGQQTSKRLQLRAGGGGASRASHLGPRTDLVGLSSLAAGAVQREAAASALLVQLRVSPWPPPVRVACCGNDGGPPWDRGAAVGPGGRCGIGTLRRAALAQASAFPGGPTWSARGRAPGVLDPSAGRVSLTSAFPTDLPLGHLGGFTIGPVRASPEDRPGGRDRPGPVGCPAVPPTPSLPGGRGQGLGLRLVSEHLPPAGVASQVRPRSARWRLVATLQRGGGLLSPLHPSQGLPLRWGGRLSSRAGGQARHLQVICGGLASRLLEELLPGRWEGSPSPKKGEAWGGAWSYCASSLTLGNGVHLGGSAGPRAPGS